MSSADILITSLKNCNTHTYNTGLLDGLYMGVILMTIAMSVIMCLEFYKTYKKILDKLDKMDAATICELNEQIEKQQQKEETKKNN